MSNAKRKFNGAVNAVIGKLENRAHEDVVVQLIKFKCLPILLYAAEVCALTKTQLSSLDFVVVRVAMKVFKSSNRAFILDCLDYFGLKLPSFTIIQRTLAFKERFNGIGDLMVSVIYFVIQLSADSVNFRTYFFSSFFFFLSHILLVE